ncbi:MAG TPA: RNA polymerase sigma factor [Gemmataceae bacterium]
MGTSRPRVDEVLRHLCRQAGAADGPSTDGLLLERYLLRRDEPAFEALLRRLGPMVLGVCRRVLGDAHDAEDAFQATFLVLVRRAGSIRPREMVGRWLYGVAYRTALKARTADLRRRRRERRAAAAVAADAAPVEDWRAVLDQELHRLPAKYRDPVVLCDLQGKTRREAAALLGWPEGTVATRLARARELLAERLRRLGVGPPAGSLAVALSLEGALAAVPGGLAGQTARAALAFAAGRSAVPGLVSARVAALTGGVLMSMKLAKLKPALALLLALGVIGLSVGVIGGQEDPGEKKEAINPLAGGLVAPGEEPNADGPKKLSTQLRLPTGPAPVQILARIDDEGRVCISKATTIYPPGGYGGEGAATGYGSMMMDPSVGSPMAGGPGMPSPGGMMGMPGGRGRRAVQAMITLRYDPKDITITDVSLSKEIDPKDLAKRLPREMPALLWEGGEEERLDPLHLRLYKEGTLLFVIPPRRGGGAAGGMGMPGGFPGGYPGAPGSGYPGGGGAPAPDGAGGYSGSPGEIGPAGGGIPKGGEPKEKR